MKINDERTIGRSYPPYRTTIKEKLFVGLTLITLILGWSWFCAYILFVLKAGPL